MAHDRGRNIIAAFCYVPFLAIVVALSVILVEKEDKYIRFHAFQSFIFSAIYYLVNILLSQISFGPLSLVVSLLDPIITVLSLIVWLASMYLAYMGRVFKFPYVGNIAEKRVHR